MGSDQLSRLSSVALALYTAVISLYALLAVYTWLPPDTTLYRTPQGAFNRFLEGLWLPRPAHFLVYQVLLFACMQSWWRITDAMTPASRVFALALSGTNPFFHVEAVEDTLSQLSTALLIESVLLLLFASRRPPRHVAIMRRLNAYLFYGIAATLQPGLLYAFPWYLMVARTLPLEYAQSTDDVDASAWQGCGALTTVMIMFLSVYSLSYYTRTMNTVRPLCNSVWESSFQKVYYSISFRYFSRLRDIVLMRTGFINMNYVLIAFSLGFSLLLCRRQRPRMAGERKLQVSLAMCTLTQILILAAGISNLRVTDSAIYGVLTLYARSLDDASLLVVPGIGLLGNCFMFNLPRLLTRFCTTELLGRMQEDVQEYRGTVIEVASSIVVLIVGSYLMHTAALRITTKKHEARGKRPSPSTIGLLLCVCIYIGVSISIALLYILNILLGGDVKGLRVASFVLELIGEPLRLLFLFSLAVLCGRRLTVNE
ncbi:hypothetical protein GMRT_12516 [Giardia muris]|uniref:Uncharacterized protein n=1 Tax=Giardia muris TaxID=5742 RepID=A0A4Z1SR62_GIAMU|nr:hypothetical protein GMRT_12516 [Giardia muris]|eukprot:TNJ28384.1 hypothetical protein GMRT_12516 [Giardia muris]